MSEEERFARNAEELKIDEKNKSVSSEPLQLFLRMATMLGYASILAFTLVCYVKGLSFILIADDFYPNTYIPKLNLYKEYFIYCMPTSFFLFINMTSGSYSIFICNNGLRNVIKNLSSTIFIYTLMCIGMLSITTLTFLLCNVFSYAWGEPLYYVFIIGISIYFWLQVSKFIKNKVKTFLNEDSKRQNEQTKLKNTVKVKTKGCLPIRYLSTLLLLFMTIFACYYIYIVILIYRSGSTIVKGILCLLVHPLVTELFFSVIKFNMGVNGSSTAPFYLHVTTLSLEAVLNVFRRFLFNDLSNINLTISFVFISGLEEILARWGMERKEIALRQFFGMKKLTEIELVAKRRFFSHTVTARSMLEMVSIVLAPVMIVCFSANRFTIDLGYDGLKPVDVNTLFVTTIIQLVVELLVVYMCSMIEIKQNIPMSDFFFHFRSAPIFLNHASAFLMAINWILHNFKTLPSALFCSDMNDPCTCPSFQIYASSVCHDMKSKNNEDKNLTLELHNFAALPSFDLNNLPTLGSTLGVVCIIIVSYLIIRGLNSKKRNVKELINIEKVNKKVILRKILDDVTMDLIEKSSLQKTILYIESLCRGVSPSQAKLLQLVIVMLKSQNNVNRNIVDVESVLQGSSNDRDVETWLKELLMSNSDIVEMKRRSKILNKRLTASDRDRFFINMNDNNIDLKERRRSLVTYSENTEMEVERVSKSFENNKISLPSMEIENDEADNDSFLDYLSWDFNVFTMKSKNPQSFLAWKCLSKLGLIEELRLPKLQLSNILLYVEQHYSLVNYDSYLAYSESITNNSINILKDIADDVAKKANNPYHNNLHGADVFQAVLYFSTKYEEIGSKFTSFDFLSVLFAAYIHDFNHPGLNSTYVISDWPMSGISSTFGSESPLEKHHLAMAFNLMRNVDEYNFLSSCSSTERDHFRRIVTECVMAIDLAKSMPWISTSRVLFNDYRNKNDVNDSHNVPVSLNDKMKFEMERKEMEHKILLMQLAIKCADVGHPSRSLEQHLEWSSRICAEFYSQGDKERSKGMKISALCDRNVSKANYAQGQIGFINFVSKPCFTFLNEVCLSINDNEKPWLKNMKFNVEYWEEKRKENSNNVELSRLESDNDNNPSTIINSESKYSPNELIENEVLRIENLNQDEASEKFHLFMRLCSILGYSLILCGVVSAFLILIGMPLATDLSSSDNIPRVNISRIYLIYASCFMLSFFSFICSISYCYRIIGFGLYSVSSGIGLKFLEIFFTYLFCVSIPLAILFTITIIKGIDIFVSDIIFYLVIMIFNVYFWLRFVSHLIEVRKKYGVNTDLRKTNLKSVKDGNGNESNNTSMVLLFFNAVASILRNLFAMYYVYVMIILYRMSSPIGRVALSLFVHPVMVEFVLTVMRFVYGTKIDDHPFFDHLDNPLMIEFGLNIFRRFMFNSVSIDLTVMLVVISGFQEILARSLMEWKEINVRKLFGAKPLDKSEMLAKRKYYSYANTIRSVSELSSIILAPVMYVIFSKNRYAVDLGYVGNDEVDIGATVCSTILQLVIEVMVVYICSMIEVKQNIPMSDFFFQYRSFFIFFNHVAAFISASSYILYNYKTIPTHLLCLDVNNPCSCPSFNVYQDTVCLNLTSLNSKSEEIVSSSRNLSIIILLIILGVSFIMGIIYFLIYYRSKNAKHSLDKSKLEMMKTKMKSLLDSTSNSLMEKSALQQSISSIESLCQGVSPSQAKLLQHVIEMLKNQNNVNRNIVDVESVLQGSSNDRDVETWLKEQLMSNSDIVEMKRRSKLINKRLTASDRDRFFINMNDNIIDLKERRRSLVTYSENTEMEVERDKSVGKTFENNKISLPSMEIENDEADNDSSLDYISWDFNVFAIKSKNPQSFLAWRCLSKLGLIEELRITKLQLSNILFYVEQHYSLVNYDSYSAYSESNFDNSITILHYKEDNNVNNEKANNPYHNNLHGADVFQAVLYFSTAYNDIGGNFTSFDLFSVLFAAYIHDFNHPGLNSTYVISDWPMSGISSTFGSESPLEKHHLALAFNLMRNVDEYNFLSSCSSTEVAHFRRIVTECVMATDLAKSMPWISTSRVLFNDYRKYNAVNDSRNVPVSLNEKMKFEMEKKEMDYKILLMQLAIKCADVGHPSRSLDQHLEWSSRICAEFYSQGDKERGKGMKISALCDRNVSKANYAQGQIGFINFVSKPCFTLLNEVCLSVSENEKPWMKYMKLNVEYWEAKKEEYKTL